MTVTENNSLILDKPKEHLGDKFANNSQQKNLKKEEKVLILKKMSLRKRLIKYLSEPPTALKGQPEGIQIKYLNYFFIYGVLFGRIPMFLLSLWLGNISKGEVQFTMLFFIGLLTCLALKLQRTLRIFLIILAQGILLLTWLHGRFEGLYTPIGVIIVLYNLQAPILLLILNYLLSLLVTYHHTYPQLEHFLQTGSPEEVNTALKEGVGTFIRTLSVVFWVTVVRFHFHSKMMRKLAMLQKKVAEQNDSLKQANEDLQKALDDRDTFILSFSHETRNPLNGLLGNLSILNEMTLHCEAKKFLTKTMVCAQILKNILITIMDTSRTKNSVSGVQLIPTHVDMRRFIEEISILCEALVRGNGLNYHLNISPAFPQMVVFDRERMTQVILNLVSNAAKFTQKGYVSLSFEWQEGTADDLFGVDEKETFLTSVDSRFEEKFGVNKNSFHAKWFRNVTTQKEGKLMISVKDDGCGISKEHQKIIFEKFRQIESDNSNIKLGLGLGLWISKVITNLHKGEIFINSSEGMGSRFSVVIPTVALPLVSCASNTCIPLDEELELRRPDTPERKSLRALVVEDFPINQIINSEMLKKYGVTDISIASNGQEAIQICQEKGPEYFDVITMDLEMPIMNGKEAMKRIRSWEEKHQQSPCKIIVISGNAVEREMQICTDKKGPYRADAFVTKPCDYDKLVKILRNLGIRAARGETEQSTRKKKVLLADDDESSVHLLKNFASRLDLDVLVAKDGKEAVELFEKNSGEIGAVLVDDKMQVMDGLEACNNIRTIMGERETNEIPICLVSGTKYEALPAGFSQCIMKPLGFQDFESIVNEARLQKFIR